MNSSTESGEFQKKLDDLKQLRTDFLSFLDKEMSRPPNSYELRVVGSFLHDFYTGAEQIFSFIVTRIDRNPEQLAGEEWHKELLDQMSIDSLDSRPKVFPEKLKRKLDEYRGFRHVFRSAYGSELKWKYVNPLVDEFESVSNRLLTELQDFHDQL